VNAQDWIELAAVIVGGGTVGTGVAKVHRLAAAVERVAAAVAGFPPPGPPGAASSSPAGPAAAPPAPPSP
jgi:hypothetical protein